MKCESWKDLETLILNEEVKPQKNKISGDEYQQLWTGSGEKAQEVWEQLLEKNKKFYDKDKYLDIEYLSDGNIYRRKPLEKGRPKQTETKDKRITIRLDAELAEKLNKYCQTNNITESEAIRKLISRL